MDYKEISIIFKALGDETRAKIVKMISNGSLCACKILEEFNITQPTLSYHMKMLCDAGIVNCTKKGKWCHYSLNADTKEIISKFIEEIKKIEL